jgi:hypothetical protein
MSREILYKKTQVIANQIDGEKGRKVIDHFENTGYLPPVIGNQPQSLVEWLKCHELINISALCRQAGINRSNFDKSLKMGLISPKHETVLSKILKKYGYV